MENKTFQEMAYRRMKEKIRQGLRNAMSGIVPSHITKDETLAWAPSLLELLDKATAAAIREIKEEAKKEMNGEV